MKIKFINFRRLGADYSNPVYVPKGFVRKNWSLYVAEFFSVSLGLILVWVNVSDIVESGITNNILSILFLMLGIFLVVGALCCSMENHWYRVIMSASHAFLVVTIIILVPSIAIALIVCVPSMIVIVLLNFNGKNIAYHQWCRLTGNHFATNDK